MPLLHDVQAACDALHLGDADEDADKPLADLRRVVAAPLALKSGTRRLLVSPDGAVHTAKVPSTPQDQATGVLRAVVEVLERAGASAHAVVRFSHGMTVATNALLERKGARTLLAITLASCAESARDSGAAQATGILIARNLIGTASSNCDGTITDNGFNIEDKNDCKFSGGDSTVGLDTALKTDGGELDVLPINGTSEASVAFQWPLGSPPKIAAVCRLFIKPRKIPRSMWTTRRAGVPS